jgi:transcriptional regulator with XRE-family HTH domain
MPMTNRVPRPRLRRARQALGWSLERAADEVSRRYPHLPIDPRQIVRWECGETRTPRPMNVLAVCRTYGLTPEELDLPPIPGLDLTSDLTDGSDPARHVPSHGPLVAAVALHLQSAPVARRDVDSQAPMAADLDDLRHIVAALDDARRYMDRAVVDHLRQQLAQCGRDDGAHGARWALPTVLGIVGAIDSAARQARPAVQRELLRVGAQAAEFAGFLYRDMAAPVVADYWQDRAIEWARETNDHGLEAYVILKKSQAAWDVGDARRMLELAQAVRAEARPLPGRVRAEATQQEARGHAMLGASLDVIERTLGQAHEALAADRGEAGSTLAAHYHASLLGIQTAICYCEAGHPRRSLQLYQQHLSPDVFSRRDYGYFLSLMAGTLAMAGEPDEAARRGGEAATIVTAARSGRTVRVLLDLVSRLVPWSNRPAVRELRQALLD